MERERAFVFAVCGNARHIRLFHRAAEWLARYSSHLVMVVTDPARNETPITHSEIVEVETDPELTHHQASIFLKTSLHRHLPKGNLYCYLDTDVLALSSECDDVFDAFCGPITFARDIVPMDVFSRFAAHCGCAERLDAALRERERAVSQYEVTLGREYAALSEEIGRLTERNRSSLTARARSWLRYHFGGQNYRLSENLIQEKRTGWWMDGDGIRLDEKYDLNGFIEKETGLRWDVILVDHVMQDGRPLGAYTCTHLHELISRHFGVDGIPPGWRHWNGGVFLFDDSSWDFMEHWHKSTMSVMDDPDWKVRDQGTLAATAWEMGLQQHPCLDARFNRIVDLAAQQVEFGHSGSVIIDGTKEHPALLHALGLGKHGLVNLTER